MKKLIICLCSAIVLSNFCQAQQITQHGDTMYSPGSASLLKTARSNSQILYTAFSDQNAGGKLSVMHNTNYPNWNFTGIQGFSTGTITCLDMTIGTGDFPLVAYTDAAYSNKVMVRQWDGSGWNFLGSSSGITPANVNDVSITFNYTTGQASLIYRDPAVGGKATVITWDGFSTWNVDGGAGISTGSVANLNIQFCAGMGNNVIAYKDSTDLKGWLKYYNGSSWILVSGLSFGNPIIDLDMEVDSSDFLPVLVTAELNGGIYKAMYWKFNGLGLTGTGPITTGAVSKVAVAADRLGNKIIIHNNPSLGNTLSIRISKSYGTPFMYGKTIYCGPIGGLDVIGEQDEHFLVTYIDSSFNRQINTKLITNLTDNPVISPAGPINLCAGGNTTLTVPGLSDPQIQYAWLNNMRWDTIGNPNFSSSTVQALSYAADPYGGYKYAAIKDGSNGSKLGVYKFNNTNWLPLGGITISPGGCAFPQIKIDQQGFPIVAFRDDANGLKASVLKYNGSTWNNVGAITFSQGQANEISLALDPGGRPIVAYKDLANGSKLTVMHYNGTNWVSLGVPGFTSGQADYPCIKMSPQGELYVCYADPNNGGKGNLMKWNGNTWVTIGSAGFSTGSISYITMDFNSNDDIFIGCSDNVFSGKATIYTHTYGSPTVGMFMANISASNAFNTKLMIDKADNMYLSYIDFPNYKAIIRRFDNSNYFWDTVAYSPLSSSFSNFFDADLNNLGVPSGVASISSNSDKLTCFEFNANSIGNASTVSVNQTGRYALFLMKNNIEGILSKNYVKVNVNAQPTVTASMSTDTICAGLADTLIANGANTYTWFNTSTNDTLIFNPSATSTYSVVGTDLNGCSDTAYASVTVPVNGYKGTISDLGGPVNAGKIYLIHEKTTPGTFDTTTVRSIGAGGLYSIDTIPNGNYLIKAIADTILYPNDISTYNGDVGVWDSAVVISHTCLSKDSIDIHLLQEYVPVGPGLIGGYIYEGAGFGLRLAQGPGNPTPFTNVIPGVPVKVGKNPGGNIVGGTYTDNNGFYQFDSLPCDSYYVYTDIPGYPMDTLYKVTISCTGGIDTIMNLDYFIDSNSVYIDMTTSSLQNAIAATVKTFTVYPNPSNGQIKITLDEKNEEDLQLNLFDLRGKIIFNKKVNQQQIKNGYNLNLKELHISEGQYILKISNSKVNANCKIIYLNN